MALINRRLDYLYAGGAGVRVYTKGERQVMGFFFSFLDDAFVEENAGLSDGMFEMAEEILFHPLVKDGAFDEGYVEGEKENLIDTIRAKKNNKKTYAVQRCCELMCDGEAYAVCEKGSEDRIRKADGALLYRRYLEMVKTCPAIVFYIGHEKKTDVEERLRRLFAFERQTKPVSGSIYREAPSEPRYFEEKMAVNQGKLTLGFRAPTLLNSENAPAHLFFCDIFGNTPNGKLFMNVREKMSLCYYCSLIPDLSKGLMIVTSGIDFADKETAEKEILRQLDLICQGEISDEEMAAARLSMINGYKELEDSPTALQNWYFNRILAGIDTTPAETLEQLLKVDKKQVAEEAKKVKLDTVYFLKGEEA